MKSDKATSSIPPSSTDKGQQQIISYHGYLHTYVYKKNKRSKRIEKLELRWQSSGIEVWDAMDFSTIMKVCQAQEHLARSREDITDLGRKEMALFTQDVRKMRTLRNYIFNLSLRSELGKSTFGPYLEILREDRRNEATGLPSSLLPSTDSLQFFVKDEPQHPGKGLPAIIQSLYDIRLYKPSTMDKTLASATTVLHSVLHTKKSSCPIDEIAALLFSSISALNLPTGRKNNLKAVKEHVRRISGKLHV